METEDSFPLASSACGKQPHGSIDTARRHLQAMKAHAQATGRPHFGRNPFVYRCPSCGYLHVSAEVRIAGGQ